MVDIIPSAVRAVVDWALNTSSIAALVGTGVSTSLPQKGLTYPWLQVMRITGVPQLPEAPIDNARIQFNAWGGVRANGLPDWSAAEPLILTLVSEIQAFRGASVLGGTVYIPDMRLFEGIMQLEDPDTGEARYWTDASVTVRSV